MALETFVSVDYIIKLIQDDKKTLREVRQVLEQVFPGTRGISERSVRRFCAKHDIHSTDQISSKDLDSVVSSAVAEVSSLCYSTSIRLCLILFNLYCMLRLVLHMGGN